MNYLEQLFSLASTTALVTGAARGNGRAIAEALARAGASVVLADILADELKAACDEMSAAGLTVAARKCDITSASQRNALIEFALKRFGPVRTLVNNAGITRSHETIDYPRDFWLDTFRVNLDAPFELSRRAAAVMKDNSGGSIINITSLNSERAFPDNPAYVAFKGALKQLGKSLAHDFGRYGIRVNNVGPGYFHTDMTARSWSNPTRRKLIRDHTVLGRWGQPADLAGIVVFLASDASSYITGQDIYVDGGWLIKGF